jgi:protein-disulfide isomerase
MVGCGSVGSRRAGYVFAVEESVNRRLILSLAIVLALLFAALVISRGVHPALAARTNVDSTPAASSPARAAVQAHEPSVDSPISNREEGLKATPTVAPAPIPQAASPVSDIDPHEALGSKNAPIAMEVFSDFQCPACKTLFVSTNRPLMDNYVSTGKVYLIHRDFPLPMHAHSRVAAQYSRAAAQIGKLEPVEEVLFQNQEKWEQSGDVDGTVANVLSPAEMAKVRALVKGGTLDAAINKDQALGQGYHVNQTPTTIIHSKGQTYPVVGVVTFDILRSFLDQLLSQN